jgi:signal transduction histidine kinase/HAMP domain-containing protein
MGAGVGVSEGAWEGAFQGAPEGSAGGASESELLIAGISRSQKAPGSRTVPTTGMRGGLGRTLLTAFLILAILPIAVTGGYAGRQNRRNAEQDAGSRLVAVAALKGAMLRHRVAAFITELVPVVNIPGSGASDSAYRSWCSGVAAPVSAPEEVVWLAGCAVLDRQRQALEWASGACSQLDLSTLDISPEVSESAGTTTFAGRLDLVSRAHSPQQPDRQTSSEGSTVTEGPVPSGGPIPVLFLRALDRVVLLCLTDDAVVEFLASELDGTGFGMGKGGRTSLVGDAGIWPEGGPANGKMGTLLSSAEAQPAYALYHRSNGEAVVGALYRLPEYGIGVLVEQAQAEVLAGTERVAATLIAWVLAVALGTTWIAATVIRHITRPVIDLTESAVAMAEGNLDQRLPVRSRDEIGILTHVFNGMSAELSSLYRDLESKVVERTRRLQEANYQIQRRALYLQASQEVSQAITSVRDPGMLLEQVTELVRSHFVYSSVAVYLADPGGGEARLHASSPLEVSSPLEASSPPEADATELTDRHVAGDQKPVWPARYGAGDGSIVGRALRWGTAQVDNRPAEAQDGWTSRVVSRVAIPLKIAGLGSSGIATQATGRPQDGEARSQADEPGGTADSFGVVGAIAVVTTAHEGIQRDELKVLEALANQVTIALENARAYERERLAAEQLGSAEAFKARFLANMSHELMEPLNTIIGFSRLLLKEFDGPVNERQREDLTRIHGDGQHLRMLFHDILSISELQAGLVGLRLEPVRLSELVAGLVPTASALVRGKGIALDMAIPVDLPDVRGDPIRLRQVLVHLLNNAAKFTEAGAITIRAWANDGEVYLSVSDTGMGIAPEERSRLFNHLGTKGADNNGQYGRGIGLGLSLCREFVELHGGRIWVDSEVGVGSVVTFSLPVDGASVNS